MLKSNHFPLFLPANKVFDHFKFCLPNVSVGRGEKSHCLSCIFTEEHLSLLICHLFFTNEETEVSKFTQYHTTHKWQKSDSRAKHKSTYSSASSISASLSTLCGVAFKTFHNLTLSVHNIPFLSSLSLQLTSNYCNWFLNTSCPLRLCYSACFLLIIFHLVNFHSSFKPWIKPFHFRIIADFTELAIWALCPFVEFQLTSHFIVISYYSSASHYFLCHPLCLPVPCPSQGSEWVFDKWLLDGY